MRNWVSMRRERCGRVAAKYSTVTPPKGISTLPSTFQAMRRKGIVPALAAIGTTAIAFLYHALTGGRG
ncbi:MAG: hypothetical protein QXY83_05830 [Thermosphaera sp.]